MAKPGNRERVRMQSTESPYAYVTERNKKNEKENGRGKLELIKYDPILRKRCKFKEKDIKK